MGDLRHWWLCHVEKGSDHTMLFHFTVHSVLYQVSKLVFCSAVEFSNFFYQAICSQCRMYEHSGHNVQHLQQAMENCRAVSLHLLTEAK